MVEEGTHIPYYTILTRDAAPELAEIHGRMPVILPKNAAMQWLLPDTSYSSLLPLAIVSIIGCNSESI